MIHDPTRILSRREFFRSTAGILGSVAANQLLGQTGAPAAAGVRGNPPGVAGFPQFPAKAKRVIFLFQAGGPSQLDLLDYKPDLKKWHGIDLPKSVMGEAKFTGMTRGQATFPVVASPWQFAQHGRSGAWVSELFPEFAKVVDDVCIVNSMTTPQVDHDAAITYLQTGHQIAGRPTVGAWAAYGLGSECEDLPAFVVLRSTKGTSFLVDRHWGAGFLPSRFQGIRIGDAEDEPVKFLNNPRGMNAALRGRTIADIGALNRLHQATSGDPEIETRIGQFEMAARMQLSVPELADLKSESAHSFALYGEDAKTPGTYAYNALMARRLVERGVRFVQLFQGGWDQHGNLPRENAIYCRHTDRANAALILDLKQRGLLDDTLVVWGGEFGRTVFCQGKMEKNNFGREHHGLCFTMWLAGGGVKPGIVYGRTDEWGFRVTENPVTVHDLYATIMHQLGIHHERLTFRFQGRDFRLTDLYGNVVRQILA
ncbi:MAG: DUF1501 domain-containing protein [Opitutus sp.]|nr:DUF1501 domain-containing protein [Opitutus sp.]